MRKIDSAGGPGVKVASWKPVGQALQCLRCDCCVFVLILAKPGLDSNCDYSVNITCLAVGVQRDERKFFQQPHGLVKIKSIFFVCCQQGEWYRLLVHETHH